MCLQAATLSPSAHLSLSELKQFARKYGVPEDKLREAQDQQAVMQLLAGMAAALLYHSCCTRLTVLLCLANRERKAGGQSKTKAYIQELQQRAAQAGATMAEIGSCQGERQLKNLIQRVTARVKRDAPGNSFSSGVASQGDT